jgi:hypothetical protein
VPKLRVCCALGCILHLAPSQPSTHSLDLPTPLYSLSSICTHFLFIHSHSNHSILCHIIVPTVHTMSTSRDASVSSIPALTHENYRLWADDMKSWLQLNGLWRLVSGSEKKPAGKPEVLDSKGTVLTPAAPLDEDKLERWEVKAERACGALKTAISHELRVLIRDCEDDPLLIWDTLKASFVQQRTALRFNAYHTLLSTQKDDSESLDSLINKVDEQIRVIKSLSPSSFTLDNLYDELAVMAIIRVLPHSFDDVVRTISVLDKFDKPSVIQSLRNMDQTRSNLSGTSSAFAASSAPSKLRSKASFNSQSNPSRLSLHFQFSLQWPRSPQMRLLLSPWPY